MKREKICHFINTCEKNKKGLVILMAKTVKDSTNHSLKLSKPKGVFTIINASVCSNAS